MDYVKIPQNVRVEDKLIGPLSLRQIIIIAVGGGTSYVLFAGISKTYGSVPIFAHVFIWIPLALCAAIALVKINDIPLTRYAFLVFELMVKPRKRVWQPRRGLDVLPRATTSRMSRKKKKAEEEAASAEATAAREEKSEFRLEELSVVLDREGEAVEKVTEGAQAVIEGTVAEADAITDADAESVSEHGDRLNKLWKEMKSSSPASPK